jgi:two-component system, chemotaxis family, protein-glutamate methylesterase/glutaminase
MARSGLQSSGTEAAGAERTYRDVVVIGASAGGIPALEGVVRSLPLELPASVFVVLHLSAGGRSVLPSILTRMGSLPATVPEDGQRAESGHIYVAPPDRHLLLTGNRIRVTGGPRENGHRPAIDPLFRSAAMSHGPRVIGVVLSGNLDDGSAGATAIRDRGGTVLVQDPSDAAYPDMPRNALEVAGADAVLPASDISDAICELLEAPLTDETEPTGEPEEEETRELAGAQLAVDGLPTELGCPECGGALWERDEGDIVRFGCRVGHVYSPESLVAEHGRELEKALWAALRGLDERADLYRLMSRRAHASGKASVERRFRDRADSAERHGAAIRDSIAKLVATGDLTEETL